MAVTVTDNHGESDSGGISYSDNFTFWQNAGLNLPFLLHTNYNSNCAHQKLEKQIPKKSPTRTD